MINGNMNSFIPFRYHLET